MKARRIGLLAWGIAAATLTSQVGLLALLLRYPDELPDHVTGNLAAHGGSVDRTLPGPRRSPGPGRGGGPGCSPVSEASSARCVPAGDEGDADRRKGDLDEQLDPVEAAGAADAGDGTVLR